MIQFSASWNHGEPPCRTPQQSFYIVMVSSQPPAIRSAPSGRFLRSEQHAAHVLCSWGSYLRPSTERHAPRSAAQTVMLHAQWPEISIGGNDLSFLRSVVLGLSAASVVTDGWEQDTKCREYRHLVFATSQDHTL